MRKLWSITLLLILFVSDFQGCRRSKTSLEEVIAALPDEWGMDVRVGAPSNNFEILSRVTAVTNASERIRLTRLIRDHFWHSPEWFVSRLVNPYHERLRFSFVCNCAGSLIRGIRLTPETISAGWKLDAEYLDVIERLCELTDDVWHKGKMSVCRTEEEAMRWHFANLVHRDYEQYFKYQFLGCVTSYRQLAPSYRPSFVKQIKRDFFHRAGMKYVDTRKFPREFFE